MAIFAIKTGINLLPTPQTNFPNLNQAIVYAINYADVNHSYPTIIGTSTTVFTWKYRAT